MRGHSFLYRRTDENLAEAKKYLNQAIKLDENSVSAYHGLTWVNFLRVWYGKTREVEQSREEARVDSRDPTTFGKSEEQLSNIIFSYLIN